MTVASSESAEQTPRPISQGKVEASVARRLRAPPEALMPQELKSVIIRLLTQPSVHLQQNCRLQLFAIGLLRGPKPAKASSLHVRRSYFGPVRNRPVRCLNLLVVEPPGTAPGSEPLITRTFIAIVRRLSQYRGVCPPAEGGRCLVGAGALCSPPERDAVTVLLIQQRPKLVIVVIVIMVMIVVIVPGGVAVKPYCVPAP